MKSDLQDSVLIANQQTEARKYAEIATALGFPKDSYPLNYDALHAKRYGEAADILVKALNARDPEHVRLAEAVRLIVCGTRRSEPKEPGTRGAQPPLPIIEPDQAARNRPLPGHQQQLRAAGRQRCRL